jgi:hypothetical protein
MRNVGTVHIPSGNLSAIAAGDGGLVSPQPQATAEAAAASSQPRPRGRDGKKALQTPFRNLYQ